MAALCSLFNSHKQPNRTKELTWPELVQMVKQPLTFKTEEILSKNDDGQMVMMSHKMAGNLACISATDCVVKTKTGIEEHNKMSYLRVDSDDGDFTIRELAQGLVNIGFNTFAIHSSWRHSAQLAKLKVMIPLSEPVDLVTWQNLQERVTDAMGTDPCMNKRVQISYIPATYLGGLYEEYVHEAGEHNLALLPALPPPPPIQVREASLFNQDEGSIIDLFCSDNSIGSILLSAGYRQKGKKWMNPESSSGVAGGRITVGDSGKEYFWTDNQSDRCHGFSLDAFGVHCAIFGCDQKEFAAELGREEYIQFTKDKQIAYAKKMDEGAQITVEGVDYAAQLEALNQSAIQTMNHSFVNQAPTAALIQQKVAPVCAAPIENVQPVAKPNPFFEGITAPANGTYDEAHPNPFFEGIVPSADGSHDEALLYNFFEGITNTTGTYDEALDNDLIAKPQTAKEVHVSAIMSKPQFEEVLPEKDEQQQSEFLEFKFETPVDQSIDIHNAPGVVGEAIKYINKMGRKPRKTLAVSTALSSVGCVGGLSHVDTVYGATSNIFCFNVAGSGSGKEAILQAGGAIIDASGLGACVMGKIKSEQEIYRNLIRSQASYYNIDEIGEVLGKITSSTETYMTGIIGTLMALYSKANGRMKLGGDELSDIQEATSKRVKALEKKIENNEDKGDLAKRELDKLLIFRSYLEQNILLDPFLAISGCTTPEMFGKIATRENVLSGFIGRSLMFREHNDTPQTYANFQPHEEFPEGLAHNLRKIRNVGDQDLIEVGRIQNYDRKEEILTNPEAKEWLDALAYNIYSQAEESSKTDGLQAIYNRQFELILKVSMILAIGDGKTRTLAHVKWAQKVVAGDVETKVELVSSNDDEVAKDATAEEKLEMLKQKVHSFLVKKGTEFLPSAISRNIRGSKKAEIELALISLIKLGYVVAVISQGKKTKYKTVSK